MLQTRDQILLPKAKCRHAKGEFNYERIPACWKSGRSAGCSFPLGRRLPSEKKQSSESQSKDQTIFTTGEWSDKTPNHEPMHGGKASFLAVRHSPEVLLHVRNAFRKGNAFRNYCRSWRDRRGFKNLGAVHSANTRSATVEPRRNLHT